MAPTPWWGFCQTLLQPGRGVEQSRGAGSAPIPIPAVSTTAQRCGVSLCLCSVSLCLVHPLFIAIYCLFIILPTTTPAVFIIECSPGAEGVSASLPPLELAPAAPGAGGSGDIQALSPLVSLPWGVGQKGKQHLAEGEIWVSGVPFCPRAPLHRHDSHSGGLTSPPVTATGTGVGGTQALSPLVSPPLNPRAPRSLPGPRDFQRTKGHARYPGRLQSHGVSVR